MSKVNVTLGARAARPQTTRRAVKKAGGPPALPGALMPQTTMRLLLVHVLRKLLHPVIMVTCATLLSTSVWADNAPVVDLNQSNTAQAPVDSSSNVSAPDQSFGSSSSGIRQDLPNDERLRLLEQQLANLAQMNLPGKIDNLQQQVQQLTGQLEVQTHNIEQLTNQVNKFYQDLDQRISKSTSNASNTAVDKTTADTDADKITQAETNVTNSTAPKTTAASSKATADIEKAGTEADAYQTALNLLSAKKNTQAISAFQAFLKKYPSGTFAPNAYFWLGQLYSTTGKNDLASQQFTTLITQFPDNSKVPDAMLKLAVIHDNAGKHTQAKSELQKIIKQYPDSSAARLAKIQLQQTTATSSDTTVSPAQ